MPGLLYNLPLRQRLSSNPAEPSARAVDLADTQRQRTTLLLHEDLRKVVLELPEQIRKQRKLALPFGGRCCAPRRKGAGGGGDGEVELFARSDGDVRDNLFVCWVKHGERGG